MRAFLRSYSAPALLIALAIAAPSLPARSIHSVESQTRRQGPRALTVKEVRELPAASKRYALVIGVDEYQDTQITRLDGAANDAKALADALVSYAGFDRRNVILMATDQPLERQPTRGNILRRLSNLRGVVPKDGLLVVAFSGHGIERGGRAYLCPSDAQLSGDISLLEDTAINVETIKERIRQTRVGQVLILLDACRNNPSGRGDDLNPLTDNYARSFNFDVRNRDVTAFATLYATSVGNVAYEYKEKKQGYFTWALIEGLRGAAANDKGEVTLAGLRKYVEDTVPKQVSIDLGQDKRQRPFAIVEGYKADELVISIIVRIEKPSGVPSVDPAAIELEFWRSIQDSSDSEDYREYLAKYPNGTFAGLARNKMRGLEAASKPSSSTPASPTGPAGSKPGAGASSPLPLRGFEFDTVTVNSSGSVTNRRRGQARYFTEDIKGVSLEMIDIPGGTFLMGSPPGEGWDNERPQHRVRVPAFYMGKYEVTQAQWRAVARLPKIKQDLNPNPSIFKGDDLPVENVTWEDAVEFCERLSKATGRRYRLPSEAEWEYASRAGTTTPFAFGATITPELVNYDGNRPYAQASKGTNRQSTTAVGSMGVANAFGLYDMHGNVREWCQDVWHDNFNSAPTDGSAWESEGDLRFRVVRGGSWFDYALHCRSATRSWTPPDRRSRNFGFRVVLAAQTH